MELSSHHQFFLPLVLLWFLASPGTSNSDEETKCNNTIFINSTEDSEHTFSSPGYPNSTYAPGLFQSWCFYSPKETTLLLFCEDIDIPKSDECELNGLIVFSEEDDLRSYCGTNAFETSSTTNNMIVTLHSSKKSRGGKFYCRVIAKGTDSISSRAIVYENCDCGYSYRMRIVGGVETGINEFPFMAGVIDSRRGAIIYCGGAIITRRIILTAEHCLVDLVVDRTAVVVGEHNVTTGSETPATVLIRASAFIHYPFYDSTSRMNDIGLIRLVSDITFTARVGPVCLPFYSRNWDLTGESVTAMGWGTIEFGGPRSKVLLKTFVNIVNIARCQEAFGGSVDSYSQYCTYGEGRDTCQYDSGGPLVWINPVINRYEVIGLVSYGRGCAAGIPSVNTKVAPYLQWILDNTPTETYCYKST